MSNNLYIQREFANKPEGLALRKFLHSYGESECFKDDFAVPYGSVEWMLEKFPKLKEIKFNPYYIEWCGGITRNIKRFSIKRNYGLINEGEGARVLFSAYDEDDILFLKPIIPKEFVSRPYHRCEECPKSFYYSRYTEFNHEWRAYISNGEVLGVYWYRGITEAFEEVKPDFAAIFPDFPKEGVYAIDFGITKNNKGGWGYDIVEMHLPYSIGWYGKQDESEVFFKFCLEGWKWMKEKYEL